MDTIEILENSFTKFFQETDYHTKIKNLHSLVQMYLLHFKDELETNLKTTQFLELLSEVPHLCRNFLQTSKSTTENETTECTTNLRNKTQNLESASLCFDILLVSMEAFCMTNHCIILVELSLRVLCEGYIHCKESEMIYGDLLEQFASELGIFFKKIENLQMAVLQQLDKLDITKFAEDDLHINCAILEMGNLCQLVFDLDADVAFELWTKYLRFISDHKSLKHISNINSVSTCLALKNIEVLQLIKFNSDKNCTEDDELSAKFFFYLEALSNITKLVGGSIDENISQFITFLLNLLDCLISSYSPFTIDKTGMNIIKNSLMKNTFSLLSYMFSNEGLLKSVFSPAQDKEFHLSGILLKLCSLQFVKSASLQLKEDFLKDILSNFLSNNDENDMKLVSTIIPCCTVTKTNSDESVTLYQFAYEQITTFLKLMPDSVIKNLGNTVFNSLLSSSDVIYLLISDVWIYRLRCSSIEFLNDQCYAALQYIHMEGINNNKIENFINRMFRFLPCSYKTKHFEAFSSVKCIQDTKNVQHRFGIPDQTSTESEIKIDSEEQIKGMIFKLIDDSSTDALQLVKKACISLELCAFFVNTSGSYEILQFLEFASKLFKTEVFEIQIAVLTFIKSLSKKSIPEHNQEFEKIVTHLAQLFSEAIHSKNYIVRYEAQNMFSYFAKCTPHIKIVQETVRRDPSLKPAMKSYINALPENNFLPETEKATYLNKQIYFKKEDIEIPPEIVKSLQQMFSMANFKFLT